MERIIEILRDEMHEARKKKDFKFAKDLLQVIFLIKRDLEFREDLELFKLSNQYDEENGNTDIQSTSTL